MLSFCLFWGSEFDWIDTYFILDKKEHVHTSVQSELHMLFHNAPVVCNPCPPPVGKGGDRQAKLRGNYFLIVPAVQEKLGSLPKEDFLLQRVGQRAIF